VPRESNVDYAAHVKFHVHLRRTSDGRIHGEALERRAVGDTEEEVVALIAQELRDSGWAPPAARRYGPRLQGER
jgi:hypothetical protein